MALFNPAPSEPLPADAPRGPQLPSGDRWPAIFFGQGPKPAQQTKPAHKREGTVRFTGKRIDLAPVQSGKPQPSLEALVGSAAKEAAATVRAPAARIALSPGAASARKPPAEGEPEGLLQGSHLNAGGPPVPPPQVAAQEPGEGIAPSPRSTPLKHQRVYEPSDAVRPYRTARIAPPAGRAGGEKREIWLGNGEKLSGPVLSETDSALTIDHPVLGSVSVSKHRVARRLAEIFLRNGDRLVGELVNESPEAVSLEHSGLGLITIPRSEICSRIASFQLENGDRVCGEVLEETAILIRLKSDSLGVITVPRAGIRAVLQKTY